MTMETRRKREGEKERGRKVSIDVYLPIYLSIEETEGGLGWTNGGSDGKRERRGCAKREEKGENGKRV